VSRAAPAVVQVRPARTADAAAIAAIFDQGIAERQATFETTPRRGEEIEQALARYPYVVAEADGRVVGWAGLSAYSERSYYSGVAECAAYVERTARGRGVGSALIEGLAREAERQGYYKLVGKLFTGNLPSIELVRRCGFREVGVHHRHGQLDGEWRDVLLVERLLGPAASA
jgi:L-amino acid N-acyltransferase YncA